MKRLAFIERHFSQHWVGNGFPVRTIFSYHQHAEVLSPFLLLDYAGPVDFPPSDQPRGVGPHPHRGFETVTIVYAGEIDHRDSSGAGGRIGPGEVQWMTAASGLVHEEMHSPEFTRRGGRFEVIQLWVNLPGQEKMTRPRYQALTAAQIPKVALSPGTGMVRVIAGQYDDTPGPARTVTPINLWDVRFSRRASFQVPAGYTTALFVRSGRLRLGSGEEVGPVELAVLEPTEESFVLEALEPGDEVALLVLNGQPIREPLAGYGPFVMNREEEVQQAMEDFQLMKRR